MFWHWCSRNTLMGCTSPPAKQLWTPLLMISWINCGITLTRKLIDTVACGICSPLSWLMLLLPLVRGYVRYLLLRWVTQCFELAFGFVFFHGPDWDSVVGVVGTQLHWFLEILDRKKWIKSTITASSTPIYRIITWVFISIRLDSTRFQQACFKMFTKMAFLI